MEYSEIRDLLAINKVNALDCDIVLSVKSALSKKITDEEFNLLCGFTYSVWNDVDKGYTQLIADIVVDLYCNEDYGYRDEEHIEKFGMYDEDEIELNRTLSKEQLEKCDYRVRRMVEDIFYEKYYN